MHPLINKLVAFNKTDTTLRACDSAWLHEPVLFICKEKQQKSTVIKIYRNLNSRTHRFSANAMYGFLNLLISSQIAEQNIKKTFFFWWILMLYECVPFDIYLNNDCDAKKNRINSTLSHCFTYLTLKYRLVPCL